MLNDGLEVIGYNSRYCKGVFRNSALEEITLPKSLKEMNRLAFSGCENLKTIYVDDECDKGLFGITLPDSVRFLPSREVMISGKHLSELREQKEVVIPDGVERIGSCWFRGSAVERVTIAASVKSIGANAFYGCEQLK